MDQQISIAVDGVKQQVKPGTTGFELFATRVTAEIVFCRLFEDCVFSVEREHHSKVFSTSFVLNWYFR